MPDAKLQKDFKKKIYVVMYLLENGFIKYLQAFVNIKYHISNYVTMKFKP